MKYIASVNVASKLKIALDCDLQVFPSLPGEYCTNCLDSNGNNGTENYYATKSYNQPWRSNQLNPDDIPLLREIIAEVKQSNIVIIQNDYMVRYTNHGWYNVNQLPKGWDLNGNLKVTSLSDEGYVWGGGDRTIVYQNRNTGVLNIPAEGGQITYTSISIEAAEDVVIGKKSSMGGWVQL